MHCHVMGKTVDDCRIHSLTHCYGMAIGDRTTVGNIMIVLQWYNYDLRAEIIRLIRSRRISYN